MQKTIFLLLMAFFAAGCGENRIDQVKFEKAYRSAKALQTCDLGDSTLMLSQYSKEFEIECSILLPSAKTMGENDLTAKFCDASHYVKLAVLARIHQNERIARYGKEDGLSSGTGEWRRAQDAIANACEWYERGEVESNENK
jgi:hypothetical protein